MKVEKEPIPGETDKVKLVITPVCLSEKPKTEVQLRSAVQSVLRALSSLHKAGYVHRDIRWENVLKSNADTWLLTDFEEAAKEGGTLIASGRNNAKTYLAPEVHRDDCYGKAADLWAVEQLMAMWAVDTKTTLSKPAESVLKGLKMKNPSNRLTAETALDSPWFR